ncbi:hypothetical protein, partial [Xylanibacter brevis]|uniref:hypothetical protein n=1 Tax=Xylanibacter brevis TaxID=83231 RepID=UPI002657C53D
MAYIICHLSLVTCHLLILLSYIWLVRIFSLSLPQMIEYIKKLLCIIALALDVLIRLAGIETNL